MKEVPVQKSITKSLSGKRPNQVLHLQHALLLWPLHRPLPTASHPFVPVHSFFSWHPREVRHHASPLRGLTRNVSSKNVVRCLEHRFSRRLCSLEIDSHLPSRCVEKISSRRVTIADPRALDIQKRLVLNLKRLQHLLFSSLEIPFDVLYLLFRCTKTSSSIAEHHARTEYTPVRHRGYHDAH